DNEWQLNYDVAGSGGSVSSGVVDHDPDVWHTHRMKIASGATRIVDLWIDRAHLYGPSTLGAGPTIAGGIGFIMYGGAGQKIASVCMFPTTVLTVVGLTSGMGFRVFDSVGSAVG